MKDSEIRNLQKHAFYRWHEILKTTYSVKLLHIFLLEVKEPWHLGISLLGICNKVNSEGNQAFRVYRERLRKAATGRALDTLSGFKAKLLFTLAVGTWATLCTFLSLNFLICEMGDCNNTYPLCFVSTKWHDTGTALHQRKVSNGSYGNLARLTAPWFSSTYQGHMQQLASCPPTSRFPSLTVTE